MILKAVNSAFIPKMRTFVMVIVCISLSSCSNSGIQSSAVPKSTPPAGMILVRGGEFTMGSDEGNPDERPAHRIQIRDFFLDIHEVTNGEFAAFIDETGYVTVAELPPDPKAFPDVPQDRMKPGSAVFTIGKGWHFVYGANWRHPSGPASSIDNLGKHPVVQVCWEDASAYAKWAGKRLPTEAEWEYAAKAGRKDPTNIWGDAAFDDKNPQANIWQGSFPTKNDNSDGFLGTAPVGSFPPNPLGLHDMAGNVWEWCSDWYRNDAYKNELKMDPHGPDSSFDPDEPNLPKRVLRGGSFLCADCYCRGYRPTARMKSSPDTGLIHTGFRCAKNK